ncbi:MAG: rRNA cytosine-C5-methyltransferase [Paludibacteraceae bacterium]|nr:rRNA cytosine-C5-methyltransferase [Paludibacteraceae bacterium]
MLPVEFIERMRQQLGGEADLLFQSLEQQPVTSIRLNDKQDVLTFDCDIDEVPWQEDGYYLSERPVFTLDPLFHAGCYYVQEASSMFLQQALEQYVTRDAVVLDLCAAPGGKSTLLSQYLGQGGLLISNEVVRQRVFILSENIQKWGNGNTIVTHNSPAQFGEQCTNLFDCVVVDAPCSGEGMFRKDPQARDEWSPYAVQQCAERQRSILLDVWDALRPGGVLIYSTCTFNREENEENVQWIAECLGAEVLPLACDPEWGITEGQPGYHFYPHRAKGEGFYICALRKTPEDYAPFRPKLARSAGKQQAVNSDYIRIARTWLQHPENWAIRQSDRFLTAYPLHYRELIEWFSAHFTCVLLGFGLGEERGRTIAPQHSVSMLKDLRREAFPQVALSQEQALAYLRTEALMIDNMSVGLVLLTYENVPLGFAKNVGNRLNNLYPNEWRIRKL